MCVCYIDFGNVAKICGQSPAHSYICSADYFLFWPVRTTLGCFPWAHRKCEEKLLTMPVLDMTLHWKWYCSHVTVIIVCLIFRSLCQSQPNPVTAPALLLMVLYIWCLISNHSVCFLFPQGSGDHPGPAVLRGHRHVVPGLCDSRALPGMAPLPGSLRVRSGNI